MLAAQPTKLSPQEVGRRGKEIYQREIKDKVISQHHGKFLCLDILSGDYEIGTDSLAANQALLARHPDAIVYGLRIGFKAMYSMGGGMTPDI
jgi:hypothetical protein